MRQKEHLALFGALFAGNPSAVPQRWEKNGRSGYSPIRQCHCPTRCQGEAWKLCPSKENFPWSDDLLLTHLSGERFLGVYPLNIDKTLFCAADFDGHRAVQNPLEDVKRYLAICETYDFQVTLERSQSGNGFHSWHFFSDWVPAWKARTVVHFLLTQAQVIREEHVEEAAFDRIFPAQNKVSADGYGNLIALPLHGGRLKIGNTAFLDPVTLESSPDQWKALELTHAMRIPEARLDEIIEKHKLQPVLGLQGKKSESRETAKVADTIPEGTRHDALVSLGGSMRRRGMTAEEIFAALQAVNSRRCRPLLSDGELHSISNSMERYSSEPLSSKNGGNEVNSAIPTAPFSVISTAPSISQTIAPDPVPSPDVAPKLSTIDLLSAWMLTEETGLHLVWREKRDAYSEGLKRILSIVEIRDMYSPAFLEKIATQANDFFMPKDLNPKSKSTKTPEDIALELWKRWIGPAFQQALAKIPIRVEHDEPIPADEQVSFERDLAELLARDIRVSMTVDEIPVHTSIVQEALRCQAQKWIRVGQQPVLIHKGPKIALRVDAFRRWPASSWRDLKPGQISREVCKRGLGQSEIIWIDGESLRCLVITENVIKRLFEVSREERKIQGID